jgi:hypothetical protein
LSCVSFFRLDSFSSSTIFCGSGWITGFTLTVYFGASGLLKPSVYVCLPA